MALLNGVVDELLISGEAAARRADAAEKRVRELEKEVKRLRELMGRPRVPATPPTKMSCSVCGKRLSKAKVQSRLTRLRTCRLAHPEIGPFCSPQCNGKSKHRFPETLVKSAHRARKSGATLRSIGEDYFGGVGVERTRQILGKYQRKLNRAEFQRLCRKRALAQPMFEAPAVPNLEDP